MLRSRTVLIGLAFGFWWGLLSCAQDRAGADPQFIPPLATTGGVGSESTESSPIRHDIGSGTTAMCSGANPGTSTGIASSSGEGGPNGTPCEDSTYCVADFVVGDPIPPLPEAFTCRDECVRAGAIGQWCGDNTACCDDSLVCRSDGTCAPESIPPDSTSSGTSGSSTGGSDGATTTTTR